MHRQNRKRRMFHARKPKSAYRMRRRRRMMRRIALLACTAVLSAGGFLLINYLLRLHNAASVNAELSAIHDEDASMMEDASAIQDATVQASIASSRPSSAETEVQKTAYQFIGSELLNECRTLYRINPDLVGWLNVPGELDLPVVYRDNEHYLTHDFYGRKNDSGTIFLDEAHPFAPETQYLFFHGHNVWDGSMLGNLTHYRNRDYFDENPYLYFNTLYRRETYEVFAVLNVTQEEMYGLMRLGTPDFVNGAEFRAFIESIKPRALQFRECSLNENDALMALSTCWNDDRIVVLLHRVDRSAE